MGTYDYKARILFLSDKQKEDFEKTNEVFKDKCWNVKWKSAGELGWVLEIDALEVCYVDAIDFEFRDVCKKYGVTADIYYDTSYSEVDGGGFAKILPTGYVLWDDLGEDELKVQYLLHRGPDMPKEDILYIIEKTCNELTPFDIDYNVNNFGKKIKIENKEEWIKRVKEYVDCMYIGDDGPKLIDTITSCYSELIS